MSDELTRNQQRSRRPREVRAKTESMQRAPKRYLHVLRGLNADVDTSDRPRVRGDCVDASRPCPFVACAHHLYLDVSETQGLKLNFPDLEPEQLEETCALDVADRGPATLEQVGQLMNLTRERVRQIEIMGKERIRPFLAELLDEVG